MLSLRLSVGRGAHRYLRFPRHGREVEFVPYVGYLAPQGIDEKTKLRNFRAQLRPFTFTGEKRVRHWASFHCSTAPPGSTRRKQDRPNRIQSAKCNIGCTHILGTPSEASVAEVRPPEKTLG